MKVVLHLGMPKTGTTSLQSILASKQAELAARGVIYPSQWRDEEGIAHHALGARLHDESDDVAAEMISEATAFVRSAACDRIILSSESLTNMVSRRKWPRFDRILTELKETASVGREARQAAKLDEMIRGR